MIIFRTIYKDKYDETGKERFIKLSNKPWRNYMYLWQMVEKKGLFYKKVGEPFYLDNNFEKVNINRSNVVKLFKHISGRPKSGDIVECCSILTWTPFILAYIVTILAIRHEFWLLLLFTPLMG